MTIGQLYNRMIRPYVEMPFSLAKLVDSSVSESERIEFANTLLSKKDCCLEKHFSKPVINELRRYGANAVVENTALRSDLEGAFRMKTSNLEVELNFSRANSMRIAMRGRAHSMCSLTSKHVGAEIKLAHRRKLAKAAKEGGLSLSSGVKSRTYTHCNLSALESLREWPGACFEEYCELIRESLWKECMACCHPVGTRFGILFPMRLSV